jgi:hypothetical protein
MKHAILPGTLALLALAGCRSEGHTATPTPADDGTVLVTADGRNPTIAADLHSGVTYVAWAVPDEAGADVFVARVEGETVSEPVRVNAAPGEAGTHDQAPPEVAVGPDGAVYVAYLVQTPVEGRRFPASELRVARSADGGRSFEAAVRPHDDAGLPTSHHFHDLAVGAEGAVYVSWLDGSAQDRYDAEHPRPETDDPHAHHADAGGPGTEVRVARSTDGGRTFAPAVVVAQHTCQCCRTALTLGAEGTVYVAWRHLYEDGTGPTIRDLAVARSTDGGATFSAPAPVHADGWRLDGCPHTGPALAVDGAGRLHAAWFTGAEGRVGAYHAVAADGLVFGPPRPLATTTAGPHLALAADATGAVQATWEDGEGVRLGRVEAGASGLTQAGTWAGDRPALAAGHVVLTRGDSVLVLPAGRKAPLAAR